MPSSESTSVFRILNMTALFAETQDPFDVCQRVLHHVRSYARGSYSMGRYDAGKDEGYKSRIGLADLTVGAVLLVARI